MTPEENSTADRAAKIRSAGAPTARAARRRRVSAIAAVLVIVVVVVGIVAALKLSRPAASAADPSDGGTTGATLADAATVKGVTQIPSTVYDTVAAGSSQNPPGKIRAPKLMDGKLPRFLYVGAEYCPYCAAQRWAVVAALSRFGTWKDLGATHSSTRDEYPDTASLSFHGASFTSKYVSFTGVEVQTNTWDAKIQNYPTLDKLSAADTKILQKYDYPPYVSENDNPGGIPFLDIGGTWISSGSAYNPQTLKGLTQDQIAAALSNPDNTITREILGEANHIAAAICDVTDGNPSDVCISAGVMQAASNMGQAG